MGMICVSENGSLILFAILPNKKSFDLAGCIPSRLFRISSTCLFFSFCSIFIVFDVMSYLILLFYWLIPCVNWILPVEAEILLLSQTHPLLHLYFFVLILPLVLK